MTKITLRSLVLSMVTVIVLAMGFFFTQRAAKGHTSPSLPETLRDSIAKVVADCPGEIGVALIVNDAETVVVNNKSAYPMMSVFKVHQALALCADFDRKGLSLDTLVEIKRNEFDPNTWSPMMKDHPERVLSLTVRDLLHYTLTQSDNNASNLLFKRMVGVAQTDSLVAKIIPRESFRMAYTEEEMADDHAKAYANYTSPLGAASLMNRLFTDSLVSADKQEFLKRTLKECRTGTDRIVAPLQEKGVMVAHKTGSGYRNEDGALMAHNDVAYVSLPSHNIDYALAVFVKDFKGEEAEASRYVARVSAVVYDLLVKNMSFVSMDKPK